MMVASIANAVALEVPQELAFDDDYRTCGQVRAKLAASSYPAVRRLACQVVDGVVILLGQTVSYYLRQVAQSQVHELTGIRGVINLIEVSEPAEAVAAE